MAYLNELHPEVYAVTPRPGGIANIKLPKSPKTVRMSMISGKASGGTNRSFQGKGSMSARSSSYKGSVGGYSGKSSLKSSRMSAFETSFLTSTPEKDCRESRIQKVLHTSQWMLPDEDDFDDDTPIRMADPVSNELMILSVVISTIMLMAGRYPDINKEHMRWTLSYLECIKDEFGYAPPNVRGIMNNIRLIDDTLESFLETEIDDMGMLDAATEPVGAMTVDEEEKETAVAEPTPDAV